MIIVGICIGWHWLLRASWMHSEPPSDANLWQWEVPAFSPDEHEFSFSPHLFDAPILWAVVRARRVFCRGY